MGDEKPPVVQSVRGGQHSSARKAARFIRYKVYGAAFAVTLQNRPNGHKKTGAFSLFCEQSKPPVIRLVYCRASREARQPVIYYYLNLQSYHYILPTNLIDFSLEVKKIIRRFPFKKRTIAPKGP